MSKFVLKPAHLLQTRLVLTKDAPALELDFNQLLKRFVPANSPNERFKLVYLKHGTFLGLSRSQRRPGEKCIFRLMNIDRRGNIDFVLKRDPTFEVRMIEAFFVESAEYDGKVSEQHHTEQVA